MSITDELREYALGWDERNRVRRDLRAIADRIDAKHGQMADFCERLERAATDREDVTLWGVDYTALPFDADGEPIHVGDRLDGYGKTIEVVEMRHGRSGWVLISRDGNGYADTFAFTHHAPTVEDVLREFANEVYADADNEIRDRDFLCAKYAKRLTLAEEEDA